MTNLSALEFEDLGTLQDVTEVVQRIEQVLRIKHEIQAYIHELGTEGRLIRMQLEELVAGIEKEEYWLVKDYIPQLDEKSAEKALAELQQLSSEGLSDRQNIARIIGYTDVENAEENAVMPRGNALYTIYLVYRLPSSKTSAGIFPFVQNDDGDHRGIRRSRR